MKMNRQMRRASEANGRRLQKKEWNEFEDVTEEAHETQKILRPNATWRPDRVYKNNKYIVQVTNNSERNGKLYRKILCRRSDSEPIYSWHDLYRIKNEIFGEETEAVQFMPPLSQLVDDANLYWFWIEQKENDL